MGLPSARDFGRPSESFPVAFARLLNMPSTTASGFFTSPQTPLNFSVAAVTPLPDL
ncbi:hypothetical protein ACFQ2B_21370 [Streptomyces stramineus]